MLRPAVVVDHHKLTANISAMQAIADGAGVRLRPHAKTHKSIQIAQQQITAGAVGLTVAKPSEALVFLEAGIPSIKICYPVIDPALMRPLLTVARDRKAEVIGAIDSTQGLAALEHAAAEFGLVLPVHLEVDVGLERCGVMADSQALLDLAAQAIASPHLDLLGLTAHAGHAYAAQGKAAAAAIAEAERQTMLGAKARLEAEGIPIREICVGATPSLWAQEDFTGITEIKPGNYVFNDLTQLTIGVVGWDQLALTVRAQVVSANDRYLIINAGSKTLTSDLGPHGNQSITGHGRAFTANEVPGRDDGRVITKLSEEHGWIAHHGQLLPIGTMLTIYPNHSCPVVNLTDQLVLVDEDQAIDSLAINARGCV